MNLVKWMRKNNRKIMAVVVVLIMIAFVGGYGLQQVLSRLGGGPGGIAGYYLDNQRITGQDIGTANTELKVLRSLFAAEMLRYRQTIFGSPDFKARLLGQLLFPDAQSAAMTSAEMYQAMAQGQLEVSGRQIDEFFEQARGRSEIYWILLRAEARRAGCVVSESQARTVLADIVPQIARGASVAQLLDGVISTYHMPEQRILRLFGDFLGVMTYANVVTSTESVTTGELRALAGRSGEKLSAELVKFAAADFIADQNEPSEEALAAQFERYREIPAGQISDDNPYGFGYKLPARVQLEYMVIEKEQVESLIKQPTQEDMERYYARNISQFQEEIKTDPSNPDSPSKTVSKRYAEVAEQIKGILIDERTDRMANLIINDVMEQAEAGFVELEMDKATAADLQAHAKDYVAAASKVGQQHGLTVHTGRTGMLSMANLSGDRRLGMLSVEGPSRMPVGLPKIVFAVDELNVTTLGPFEVQRPRMWENIGPLHDRFGSLLAVVRVVGAAKAEPPADIDVRYSVRGPVLGPKDESEAAVHSVREKVADDCKLLAAMDAARARSEEFVRLLSDKSWTEAVDKYNEVLANNGEDSGLFAASMRLRSEKLSNRMRMSERDIEQMQERFADMPMAAGYIRNSLESKRLNDRLFAMLGDERMEVKDIHAVIAFEPGAAFYVIKDISRTPASQEDYQQSKALRALSIDLTRSQSLSLIHYKPDNILERMSFRWAERETDEATETSKPQEAAL